MLRTIATAGVAAAAVLGAGTAALAASGSGATAGAGSTGTAAKPGTAAHAKLTPQQRRHARRAVLRSTVHGSFVTKGKDGYVVHTGVRGTVTSVSSTAVTVRAADGYTATFHLTKDTKVRERVAGKRGATAGKLADVHAKDRVLVVGRRADKAGTALTATVVVDGLRK